MARNKTTVKIDGQEYTLAGDESVAYMHEVASLVDRKMVEVRQKCDHLSTAMTAVLAAVNIADELIKEQRKKPQTKAKKTAENKAALPDNVKAMNRSS